MNLGFFLGGGGGKQAGYMDYLASSKEVSLKLALSHRLRKGRTDLAAYGFFEIPECGCGASVRLSLSDDFEHLSISTSAPHGQMGTILRRERETDRQTPPGRGTHHLPAPAVLPATSKHT